MMEECMKQDGQEWVNEAEKGTVIFLLWYIFESFIIQSLNRNNDNKKKDPSATVESQSGRRDESGVPAAQLWNGNGSGTVNRAGI